jgi:hypothetical protein
VSRKFTCSGLACSWVNLPDSAWRIFPKAVARAFQGRQARATSQPNKRIAANQPCVFGESGVIEQLQAMASPAAG